MKLTQYIRKEQDIAEEIFTIFQGWQSATFGWQGDAADPAKTVRNYEAAKKAHDDECIRRISAAIDSWIKSQEGK